jgi:methylmalonyl-CoA mutase C-terminal domain/subunit
MEVIYTGIRQTPEQIANAAIQEGVDIVGLSSLSGAHNNLFPRVVQILQQKGAEDILVFGGGIIPIDDIPELKKTGIREIFQPGASTEDIIKYIKECNLTAPPTSPLPFLKGGQEGWDIGQSPF